MQRILFLLLFFSATLMAQPTYQPSQANLQSRAEFRDMKFGIFLHWGIYSVFGQGEWYMSVDSIQQNEYAKAAGAFYPIGFNADEWVSHFKEAGAKYICFTSRHHDGFSMWHTRQSPYNIVDATPFRRDVLKELADTKCVEFLATPFAYSLASEYNENEFLDQLDKQAAIVKSLFGVQPTTVWNTELLFSDDMVPALAKQGYKVIMTEGAKHILGSKSANQVYQSVVNTKVKVLLRNAEWSDALSFHFSDPSWGTYPMDAEKYAYMLQQLPEEDGVVNIWMGAEVFGINQRAETGIFEFLKACWSVRWVLLRLRKPRRKVRRMW
mgnify:CR=1 FL=1